MARKRKGNSLNKIERLVRKELIKDTLVVYGMVLFIMLLILLVIAKYSNLGFFDFLNLYGPNLVFALIIYFITIIPFWFSRKKDYLDYPYNEVFEDTNR